MKKVIILLMMMVIFSTAVFATPLSDAGSLDTTSSEISLVEQSSVIPNENEALQNSAEQSDTLPEKDPSQLILRIDNWFSFYDYQSFDGTPLKRKELNFLVKTVPENQPLLSKRTGVVIANWSFAVVFFASAMTAEFYYLNRDLPHAETVFSAALLTGLGALFGEIFTYQWSEDLFQRAVDNYNLSIMGIPIPTKKR